MHDLLAELVIGVPAASLQKFTLAYCTQDQSPDLPGLAYCLDSALRSASMRLIRMSLMRVR
jgi:hypothetical protein